jgi:hypothetical protein
MFGQTLAVNYWNATAPIGWEPLPTAAELTPAPQSAPDLPPDPFRITQEFDAFMPERLAAAKLRGFVEDFNGRVLTSDPGLIRLRIGVPAGYKESTGGSGIFGWLRNRGIPSVPRGQEPIELELHVKKPNPSQARLNVVVAFSPLKDYPPANNQTWRDRCDQLHVMLRRYLGT